MPTADLIQRTNYIFVLQSLSNFDCQGLSRKQIQNRQCSKPPAIRQLVGREIETPYFIGSRWPKPFAAVHRRPAPAEVCAARLALLPR
jgi:hypothetical protein